MEHAMFILLSTQRFGSPVSEFSPGPAPFLEWIETDKLVVDVTYQREIGRRGATNVNQIAENFDWSKFAPVIVAPVEGGQFAIVDGQHRTTAAIRRGQKEVPCQVVQADRAKQAAAYAAVDANITPSVAEARANDVWLRRQIRLSGSACRKTAGTIGTPEPALCASRNPPRPLRKPA